MPGRSNRLTLNVGGRFDYFNADGAGALTAPASTWVPARERPAYKNVPNFKDWAIRLAAAYDLFGDGKTALKVNASKYVASAALGFAEGFNTLTAANETRTWNDADGNRSVLDAQGNLQRNEILGGTANFGQASSVDRLDPGLRREHNWEYGASIQRELCAARLGDGRLSSPHLRQPRGHRQPEPERERVDAVHDHGAGRSAAAGRRRVPDRAVDVEPEQGWRGDRQPADLLDVEHARLQRPRPQRHGPDRRQRRSSWAA